MATVELEGVSKAYGSHRAVVQDVNLRVEDGEFMVLLGPSGCGKSTTLRMIAGLEPITEGRIRIDGRLMNRVPARDRDIAMVFQSYALYPHMTVFDNMAFGLRRRGLSKPEIARKVNSAAEGLELSLLLDRRPFALSGGQRQRVALGRAIVREPKVFLLDEPLSNLDAALRATTRSELVKLHQRIRTTMIYVTHDQVEAMTMGTRICIMSAGRIVQIGHPMEVYRDPANTFVARFLGSPAMNLLPAGIAGDIISIGDQESVAPSRLPWGRADRSGHPGHSPGGHRAATCRAGSTAGPGRHRGTVGSRDATEPYASRCGAGGGRARTARHKLRAGPDGEA